MTKDEALRMALAALEKMENCCPALDPSGQDAHDTAYQTMHILRIVINEAQPEQEPVMEYDKEELRGTFWDTTPPKRKEWVGLTDEQEPIDFELAYGGIYKDQRAALAEALAQPEQEPLEYWNAVEGWVKIDEVRKHFEAVSCGTIYKTAGEGRVPLYTAPPKRKEWVGLTDEEVAEIHTASIGKNVGVATGLTEAKLKEKNT